MTTLNDAFDGLKPLEVIERGEVDRIWQVIFVLRSGVALPNNANDQNGHLLAANTRRLY